MQGIRRENLYPILAFVVPLVTRAIPEVLMGPYVVGFDTMGHYVPTALTWLRGNIDIWRYVATAPLFYTVVISMVSLGAPLTLTLKVMPPLLHGFLALAIYTYARRALGWLPKKSMLTAFLATVYFVAMRVSWDLLRNELALILLFVALTLLSVNELGWKHYVLLSLAMVSVVLTHQLTAVIMFGVIAFTIVHGMFRSGHDDPSPKSSGFPARISKVGGLIVGSVPAALLFLLTFYFSAAVLEYRLILGFPESSDGWLSLFGFASYQEMLLNVFGFLLYSYLPILPLAILGFRRLGNIQIRSWILLSLVLMFVPMVSPSNHRWVMMLTYPLAFCVSEALSMIRSASWRWSGPKLHLIAVIYLTLTIASLTLCFLLMPPESPLPYFDRGLFNSYIYHVPSSMLQNTVSITDCRDTADALEWLKDNMEGGGLLLTHRAFYGWAILTLRGEQVILYEYDNLDGVAEGVALKGSSQIYLIWWAGGEGWYGRPTVSPQFREVYRSGKIAVYVYAPADVEK